jgi:hypothetical protein
VKGINAMNYNEITKKIHAKNRYKIEYNPVYESYREAYIECFKTSFFLLLIFAIIFFVTSGGFILFIFFAAWKEILISLTAFIFIGLFFSLFYQKTWFYKLRMRILLALLLCFMFFSAISYYCGHNQCYI